MVCAGIAALAACGGGVGTGGTGAFASGPITGFGSIIVNDVHYDERMARIEDDDGSLRDRADLRLGTVVEVDSDDGAQRPAWRRRVRITSERIGRVDAVAANTLTVNGLPVRFNAGTVFDESFSGGACRHRGGRGGRGAWFCHQHARRGAGHAHRTAQRGATRSSSAPRSLRSIPRRAPSGSATRSLRTPQASAAAMNSLSAPSSLVWVDPVPQGGRWVVQSIARGQSMQQDSVR